MGRGQGHSQATRNLLYGKRSERITRQTSPEEKESRLPCSKCNGERSYMYDENHSTVCDQCCNHDQGWWLLTCNHAGYQQGCHNWSCKNGCGKIIDAKELACEHKSGFTPVSSTTANYQSYICRDGCGASLNEDQLEEEMLIPYLDGPRY